MEKVGREPFAYQRGDGFFVESDDHARDLLRGDPRPWARLSDDECQHVIAAQLSDDVSDAYANEIWRHLISLEADTLPDVVSMSKQTEIEWYMRPYVLDFLVETHGACRLLPETLFLAVNLMDRYASVRVVYKRHYQLVACAALLVSAKYIDRKDRVPTVTELRRICVEMYDVDMFRQMERHLLQTIEWVVGAPTVEDHLRLFRLAAHGRQPPEDVEPEVMHMARYVCEAAMYNPVFIAVLPSLLAWFGLMVARVLLGRDVSPAWQDHWCGDQLLTQLMDNLAEPSPMLTRKYSLPAFYAVAGKAERFLARQAVLRAASAAPSTVDTPVSTPMLTDEDELMTEDEEDHDDEDDDMPPTPQKGEATARPAISPEERHLAFRSGHHIGAVSAPSTPGALFHPKMESAHGQQLGFSPLWNYPTLEG
ncbi:MAG: hypothetical protein M1826_001553 [Phylliscum demangeonii]|nr:MAG: hypothetical protein M1826_001553 [Phylliscum demangeonii]